MLRVGIVGADMVSERYLTNLLGDKRVTLTGVADPCHVARDRVASSYGVATFAEFRQVLDRSDMVFIRVPHHLHRPLALEAIQAGKHVVCEKPLAMNAFESEEMLAAADRAGVMLFVAESFRYIPELARMRELINSGEIGRPFLCTSCLIEDECDRMSDPASWKATKEKSGGGSIIDQGPHVLDSLYWLFGEIEKVSAIGGRLVVSAEGKEEDTAQMILYFRSGVLATCTLTLAARNNAFPEGYAGFGCRYDVNATAGAMTLVVGKGITLVRDDDLFYISPAGIGNDRSMVSDFVSAVLGEGEPLVTGADGLYVMRIVDACYESMRQQRVVSL